MQVRPRGVWGGSLSLPIYLLIRLTSFQQPGGLKSLPLYTYGRAHHIQPGMAELVLGRGPLQRMRSHLFKTKAPEPQPTWEALGLKAGYFISLDPQL